MELPQQVRSQMEFGSEGKRPAEQVQIFSENDAEIE
jgi:hypothetical protein